MKNPKICKFFTQIILKFSLAIIFFTCMDLHVNGQNYTFSYTYQNVTRVNGGGTLEKGDTIEVRALMRVGKKATQLYYIDTIPTGLKYINNSLKLVTNEGLLFRGLYTDATNDDLGVYVNGAPSRLRINIGTGAANAQGGVNFGITSGGGTLNPGDKPKFYGNTLFLVAYKLVVTANFGDTIWLTGNYYYKDFNNASQTQRFDYAAIRVMANQDLCSNFSSASFSAESSFGSGILTNRAAGVNAPLYTKVDMALNNPADNYYAVANNTSTDGTTDNTGPYKPATNIHRVFGGFWDIIGDHTNAADPLLGNPPVAPGTNGGYMLVVNAAFPTFDVYNDVINGVCPNTYYEFSAWLRNICGYCGIDSMSNPTYTPGVSPNLAFTINDVDYYNTGSIPYTQKWEKRGFIYKTGNSETSFKITIKNNAPGGGGNDWVLDDIKLATCYPNLIMNPSDTAKICAGSYAQLSDTVKSYFSNYTNYCWETSTNNGLTWVSTGVCGSKTPVLKNGMWEYVVDTVFIAAASDSGKSFRLKVGTTAANVNNVLCSVDNSQKVYMKVYNLDCTILDEMLGDFKGVLKNGYALLSWKTINESSIRNFELERSIDGVHFKSFISIPPVYPGGGNYSFLDPEALSGAVYYRLKINTHYNKVSQYSKVITLYTYNETFDITATNPFRSELKINVSNFSEGSLELNLFDSYGRRVVHQVSSIKKGNNKILLDGVSSLQPGLYILQGQMNGQLVKLKLIKN